MVKKIRGGGLPPGTTGPSSVDSTRPIKSAQVGNVGQVAQSEGTKGARKIRKTTRPITSAEREHLMLLIREEADKIFGPNGLPESERNTVEGAVRMAIDASIVDSDDDELAPTPAASGKREV